MNQPLNINNSPLQKEKSSLFFSIVSSILILILFSILIFVSNVAFCTVRQTSMTNTLNDGDSVLISTNYTSIQRGDIAVIDKENLYIIKRIIALEGDTIKFTKNSDDDSVSLYLKINGQSEFTLLYEDYIKETMTYTEKCFNEEILDFDEEFTISKDCIFVLGDNRNGSLDSRVYGEFSTQDIKGIMFYKLNSGGILEKILSFLY